MAVFHGKGGSVTFNGAQTDRVLRWSIEASCDTTEATPMARADASAWALSTAYSAGDYVSNDDTIYRCITAHTSSADDEPGTGANWTTYWSEASWKWNLAGCKRWTATVECELDDAGPDPDLGTDLVDDDGATLVLKTGLTGAGEVDYYTGTAVVTGISPAADKDGVIVVTYTFTGSGALTEHTAS